MQAHISLPFSESELAIIDRAAEFTGRSRTGFVRGAATRAAKKVILESAVVRVPEDRNHDVQGDRN